MSAWSSDAAREKVEATRRKKHARLAHLAETRVIPKEWLSIAHGCARITAGRFPCGPEAHGIDHEDLVAEALAGAWEQLLTYDPSRGASVSSWIITGCRRAVLEALRRADLLTREERADYRRDYERHIEDPERHPEPIPLLTRLSLEQTLFESLEHVGTPIHLADMLGRRDPEIEEMPERVSRSWLVGAALSAIEGQRLWVVRQWMEGRTLKEMANALNLSESRLHQIWQEALGAMRIALGISHRFGRTCPNGHPPLPKNRDAQGRCRICVASRKRAYKQRGRQERGIA